MGGRGEGGFLQPAKRALRVACFVRLGRPWSCTGSCPQNKPLLWIDGAEKWFRPQNAPYLWTDGDLGAVLFMGRSNLWSDETFVAASKYSRTCTKARMMAMFAAIAMSLLSKPESIATPCSVNTNGSAIFGLFDVITNCDDIIFHSSSFGKQISYLCTATGTRNPQSKR